jgi:predicted RNase H-like HicB family nuclease
MTKMYTMVVPYAIKSYTVILYGAEEGGYWGEVLELPGCVSQGETIDEFRHNIREALEAVLESELETPRIEIYTEPALTEKEFIQFGMLESREEKAHWVEASETWTATA